MIQINCFNGNTDGGSNVFESSFNAVNIMSNYYVKQQIV